MTTAVAQDPPGYVGLRELRANLSSYVKEVKKGRSYIVTEHGHPILRMVPLTGQAPLEGRSTIDQLIAEGVIIPATDPSDEPPPPPLDVGCTISDLIAEQRG